MSDSHYLPRQNPSVITEIIGHELYLFNPDNGSLKKSNLVGSTIWSLCDKECLVDDAVNLIVATWDVDADTARTDLLEFLDELKTEGFVTIK